MSTSNYCSYCSASNVHLHKADHPADRNALGYICNECASSMTNLKICSGCNIYSELCSASGYCIDCFHSKVFVYCKCDCTTCGESVRVMDGELDPNGSFHCSGCIESSQDIFKCNQCLKIFFRDNTMPIQSMNNNSNWKECFLCHDKYKQ
jgi:hypothetical protein